MTEQEKIEWAAIELVYGFMRWEEVACWANDNGIKMTDIVERAKYIR